MNEAIKQTLLSEKKENFYFKNNGITMICKKFSYNALQAKNWDVIAENIQIINGGQTCKTIQHTLNEFPQEDYSQVFVLVRLYELSEDQRQENEDLIQEITLATNSQNPVDLSDLRANDALQKRLELGMKPFGYTYKRKKDLSSSNDNIIPLSVAAQAIYAIWKRKPNVAKFRRKELFGTLYDYVYTEDLNPAQVVIAALIYRYCDSQRKKTTLIDKFPHIPYSNYFLSMIIGDLVLSKNSITLNTLTHKNFEQVKEYFEREKGRLFDEANEQINQALNVLFGDYTKVEVTRLAAAFRHGELLSILDIIRS